MTSSSAAQYIRMSTDKQNLSPAVQKEAIAVYAGMHGLNIIATYVDDARSGLRISNREGMKKLISDVAQADCTFKTVLVYDISRWGRFQNTDASAYYDYHCVLHGVRVIYVAEALGNDSSPLASVVRNLKRVMAAEYSRELAEKSSAGQVRVLSLGYQMGPTPCLGFRREAVSEDGLKRRLLERGERKPRANDRVRWVLAPRDEVQLVREIFEEYASTDIPVRTLAKRMQAQDQRSHAGKVITESMLATLLDCEAVIGNFLWGRPANAGSGVIQPRDAALRSEGALPAIVDADTWRLVQDKRAAWSPQRRTKGVLVDQLRNALQRVPQLTSSDLKKNGCAAVCTYNRVFGSLSSAIVAAGGDPNAMRSGASRRYSERANSCFQFLRDIEELLLANGSAARSWERARLVILNNRVRIRVRFMWQQKRGRLPLWSVGRWSQPRQVEYVLLVRMNEDEKSALDFLLVPPEVIGNGLPRYLSAEVTSKLAVHQARSGEELVWMMQVLGHRYAKV